MGCEIVETPDGKMIVCSRGQRKRCEFCDTGWGNLLCDYPTSDGKTCDRRMCRDCGTNVGLERDYCPEHVLGKLGATA